MYKVPNKSLSFLIKKYKTGLKDIKYNLPDSTFIGRYCIKNYKDIKTIYQNDKNA